MQRSAVRKAKKKIVDDLEACKPNEQDKKTLAICKLDPSTIGASIQLVTAGIQVWKASKDYLVNMDNNMCGGGVGYSVIAVKKAILAYEFARDVKNTYKGQKYEVVEWVPKSSARDCACCQTVFKTFTLRKEFAKHHCRACGRVVCHGCSASKMFYEVSGKPERTCTDCLLNGKTVARAPMQPAAEGTQKMDPSADANA